jgi:hypothetical protein
MSQANGFFCPSCGNKNSAGARFCGVCGKQLPEIVLPASGTNPVRPAGRPAQTAYASKAASSGTPWKWILAGAFVVIVVIAILILSNGKSSPSASLVGRWDFQSSTGRWDYHWMEFFEDGTYTDSWGNSRTWTILSDGRLKLIARIGGFVDLFNINIKGNTLEIADVRGNGATGTRTNK